MSDCDALSSEKRCKNVEILRLWKQFADLMAGSLSSTLLQDHALDKGLQVSNQQLYERPLKDGQIRLLSFFNLIDSVLHLTMTEFDFPTHT